MKINTSIIISLVVLISGYFFNKPYLWIPTTVLFAGVIDLFTRKWIMSDRLGSFIKLGVV